LTPVLLEIKIHNELYSIKFCLESAAIMINSSSGEAYTNQENLRKKLAKPVPSSMIKY
jgi:hypothetical protein